MMYVAQIIPRAIDYFTGKALRYEQGQNGEFDSEDDEFDDDEDEEDSDEEDSDEEAGGKRARKAPAPPMGNTPASHQVRPVLSLSSLIL